jgi:hypothetical protein
MLWARVSGSVVVDELLAVVYEDKRLFHAFTDNNFNVVALMNPAGEVAVEYVYDAFGEIRERGGSLSASPPPENPVGHQGLFADRLDAPAGSEALVPVAGGRGCFGA